jgi:hypothetical protein
MQKLARIEPANQMQEPYVYVLPTLAMHPRSSQVKARDHVHAADQVRPDDQYVHTRGVSDGLSMRD